MVGFPMPSGLKRVLWTLGSLPGVIANRWGACSMREHLSEADSTMIYVLTKWESQMRYQMVDFQVCMQWIDATNCGKLTYVDYTRWIAGLWRTSVANKFQIPLDYESALFPLIDYLEIRKHKMSLYPYLLLDKCLLVQLIYRHALTDTSLYHICAFTMQCSPIHVVLRNDSMTLAYVSTPVMCTSFKEHRYTPSEGLSLCPGDSVERPVKPLIQPRRP
jgi:hypothetical protein